MTRSVAVYRSVSFGWQFTDSVLQMPNVKIWLVRIPFSPVESLHHVIFLFHSKFSLSNPWLSFLFFAGIKQQVDLPDLALVDPVAGFQWLTGGIWAASSECIWCVEYRPGSRKFVWNRKRERENLTLPLPGSIHSVQSVLVRKASKGFALLMNFEKKQQPNHLVNAPNPFWQPFLIRTFAGH